MRVIGYVRVSTDEQSQSGAGLEVQRQAIAAECKRRGWELLEVIEDAGFSAKDLKRPGIKAALEVLKEGDAKALVAATETRIDRAMSIFFMGTHAITTVRRSRWRPSAIAEHLRHFPAAPGCRPRECYFFRALARFCFTRNFTILATKA